jgi:pimeloyl-ACP methyl ester carboxylesterase
MNSQKVKTSVLMALIVIGLVISMFPVTVSCEQPEVEGWTLTVDEGPIEGNPDLAEYVWIANRTPYGLYDKIAVRRVVRADGEAGECVVFILPGTWSSGEQLVHIRKDGVQYGIPNANSSILLYLAKRGFDVYTLDYRTHFVPHTVTNHSFMLNWGWDAWMGDMKAAVDLMKNVSSVSKIYIGGESFGGGAAMNYASVYWAEDLKGIILLDAFWCKSAGKVGGETNTFNLTEAIENMTTSGAYSWLSSGGPNNPIWAYALAHPEDTFIRDFLMDQLYLGGYANPYSYPWSQPAPMFATLASFDPYWPYRLGNESLAYIDWINCSYLSYDFDDHYTEIDVPVIAFLSELFGYAYWGDLINGIANPDFTGTLLEGYGHLDVFAGTYVREDVNEPIYQWLIIHEGVHLTVASPPITGITFTINDTPEATPYTEWLFKGSYTIEMPQTHNGYTWSHWLEDGDTNRTKTINLNTNTKLTAVYACTFDVFLDDIHYPVSILSNSTVSNFNFNQTEMQISFNVTGDIGTTGYCNITIPKSLLTGSPWKIKIDNTNVTDFDEKTNYTHTFLYFTYTNEKPLQVTIEGTWVIPEFPSAIILPLFMSLSLITVVFIKHKKKKQ